MKTLSEFSKKYKPKGVSLYYTELSEQDQRNYRYQLVKSYYNYVKRADGILSKEDFMILNRYDFSYDLATSISPIIKGTGLRRIRRIIAVLCLSIISLSIIGALLYVLGLVLYFVGGLSLVGIEIFADGSALGFIGAAAAVIITLGMFATLVKAIFGK